MLSLLSRLLPSASRGRLRGPFHHDGGHAWRVHLPGLRERADRADQSYRSTLVVYEDDVPLTMPHGLHADVRALGGGRYSHWDDSLLFSATDNSDPNTNGRTYRYTTSPRAYRETIGRWEDAASIAVNYKKPATTPDSLRFDVEHAVMCGRLYLDSIRRRWPDLTGKTVLEIGPGWNDGSALYLAAHGARPMVLDRFLAPWDDDYHPVFYARLRDHLARLEPSLDPRPFDELLRAGKYVDEVITRFEVPIEEVPLQDGSVDVTVSGAVLEHMCNLADAIRQISRITVAGGLGVHQVDFRDHRCFDRPLEHLLGPDADYPDDLPYRVTQSGTRFRPDETAAMFRAAGLEVAYFQALDLAKPEYLTEFLPRLRRAKGSRYRHRAAQELEVVSAYFLVEKTGR